MPHQIVSGKERRDELHSQEFHARAISGGENWCIEAVPWWRGILTRTHDWPESSDLPACRVRRSPNERQCPRLGKPAARFLYSIEPVEIRTARKIGALQFEPVRSSIAHIVQQYRHFLPEQGVER